MIRVFDGEALVQVAGQEIHVKSGHELNLNGGAGKLKARTFDKKVSAADDFYRWASLRSSYLAEANVDEAGTYAGGSGMYAGGWYGDGDDALSHGVQDQLGEAMQIQFLLQVPAMRFDRCRG